MNTTKDALRGLIDHISIDTLRWWFRTYLPVLAIVGMVRIRWSVPDAVVVSPLVDSVLIAAVAMPLAYLSVALVAVAAFILLLATKLVYIVPKVWRSMRGVRGENE